MERFDSYDTQGRCRELLTRLSRAPVQSASVEPWKWDILELLEESGQQLRDAQLTNSCPDTGLWKEVHLAVQDERQASSLPVALRMKCEELVQGREIWLGDFESELRGLSARNREIRERLLFAEEDNETSQGWFRKAAVSAVEVSRLLERHLNMLQRAMRLSRSLKLVTKAMQQQGVMSQRRPFKGKTYGEKLQSSLVCLAAVAVAPIPGSGEMWIATTTMMVLGADAAWNHVVYEHPRDAVTEQILGQFDCHSQKAQEALSAWLSTPAAARRGCAMVHNASTRAIKVTVRLLNLIDGTGDEGGSWAAALDNHPIGAVMKKAWVWHQGEDEQILRIPAQRVAIAELPRKPDENWAWQASFSYSDGQVGECRIKEGSVFSFICVDCGVRVGDRDAGDRLTELEVRELGFGQLIDEEEQRREKARAEKTAKKKAKKATAKLAEDEDVKSQKQQESVSNNPFEGEVKAEGADGGKNPFDADVSWEHDDALTPKSRAETKKETGSKNPFEEDLGNGADDGVDGKDTANLTEVAGKNPFDADVQSADAKGEEAERPTEEEAEEEDEEEEEVIWSCFEVCNTTEELVSIKVFTEGHHSAHGVGALMSKAICEATVHPDASQLMPLKVKKSEPETPFDVDISIGLKRTKCEIVGGQTIFVDGMLSEFT